jgi:hypothetical protein
MQIQKQQLVLVYVCCCIAFGESMDRCPMQHGHSRRIHDIQSNGIIFDVVGFLLHLRHSNVDVVNVPMPFQEKVKYLYEH